MRIRLFIILGLMICSGVLLQLSPLSDAGAEEYASVEERRILTAIRAQQDKLSERETQLEQREMELKTIAAEVDKKIAAMQQLRSELNQLLDRRDAEENARVEELSLIYERMNPQQAAVLISELETQLAVNLLLGIKKKTAGQIMERLNAETALRLSRAFTDLSVNDTPGN